MTPEEQAAAEAAAKAAEEKTKADAEAEAKAIEEAKKNPVLAAILEKREKELAAERKAKEDFKSDMLRYKGQIGSSEAEKQKAKEEAEAKEREALAKQGEWKTLYERSEARSAELDKKLKEQARAFVNDKKLSVVQAKALELGLLPGAVPDLAAFDLAAVEASQSESGAISFNGVDALIENLKNQKPHWFGSKAAPKVNFGGGGGSSQANADQSMTPEKLLKLEREDPAAYRAQLEAMMKAKKPS